MAKEVSRREFFSQLGATVGGAALAASGASLLSPEEARAQQQPKGNIPDKPYKVGHMTFFTGPAAVLGEPMYKGHILAAEEINAQGGLLGKRKIETLKADEAAGTDANVKEVPNPHYIFRITNIQSADGTTAAIATAMTWPKVRTIAHINPDYAYGRNAFDHFTIAINKLIPGTNSVYEGWPKLGTTDFTSHITTAIAKKPD